MIYRTLIAYIECWFCRPLWWSLSNSFLTNRRKLVYLTSDCLGRAGSQGSGNCKVIEGLQTLIVKCTIIALHTFSVHAEVQWATVVQCRPGGMIMVGETVWPSVSTPASCSRRCSVYSSLTPELSTTPENWFF